jgi:hypothetical protein
VGAHEHVPHDKASDPHHIAPKLGLIGATVQELECFAVGPVAAEHEEQVFSQPTGLSTWQRLD